MNSQMEPVPSPTRGCLQILMIEDNPDYVYLIQEGLKADPKHRVELICAPDLRQGMQILASCVPDLILLDLSLPDSQGFDTFLKVRAQALEVPLLILTASNDESEALRAVREGAQDYLVKGGLDIRFLIQSIHYSIERQRILGRWKAEWKKQYHLATHDSLTLLANRLFFEEYLTFSLVESRRHGGQVAVLFVDIDHFKQVNDDWGHDTGDELLQKVAQRLKTSLREEDLVARMGGDEFAILLRHLKGPEDAEVVAKRIQAILASPLSIKDRQYFVRISMGISIYPLDTENAFALITSADQAMYAVKKKGGSNYKYFKDIIP